MDESEVSSAAATEVPARRAASLGASYGLAAGLVVGVLDVVVYLVWAAITDALPNYLMAVIPMSVVFVVLPITVLGSGIGALTGVLACRRPARETPLVAMALAALAAVCVGLAFARLGLVVVLTAGAVAVGVAAVTGVRLGRRLSPPAG